MYKRTFNKLFNFFGYQLSRSNGIPASKKIFDNLLAFNSFLKMADSVEGDIVECGVGFGHSLACLYYLNNGKRNVWAFDSFEGFPEPSVEDSSIRNPKKGEWKVITPAELEDILFRRCGFKKFENKSLNIVKGYFSDTLPMSGVSKISLLHLDVDLYNSYKDCLENLYGRVSPGGVIIFDEYKQRDTQHVFPGAAKAIDEFFENKPEQISYSNDSDKYYVLKI